MKTSQHFWMQELIIKPEFVQNPKVFLKVKLQLEYVATSNVLNQTRTQKVPKQN